MRAKRYFVIKIKYGDGSCTYVYKRHCRHEGRTLITPDIEVAERYVSKTAAESWFDTVRRYWRINRAYELEAVEVEG